jgi:hypothetical protein
MAGLLSPFFIFGGCCSNVRRTVPILKTLADPTLQVYTLEAILK